VPTYVDLIFEEKTQINLKMVDQQFGAGSSGV
jgi:hypothetical protein